MMFKDVFVDKQLCDCHANDIALIGLQVYWFPVFILALESNLQYITTNLLFRSHNYILCWWITEDVCKSLWKNNFDFLLTAGQNAGQ